jgi:hypothetical protein
MMNKKHQIPAPQRIKDQALGRQKGTKLARFHRLHHIIWAVKRMTG